MASRRAVVITGIGVVSPLGNTRAQFARALLEGKSAIGEVRRFDASGFPCTIAAEVADCPQHTGLADVKINFAIEAARQAIQHARLGVGQAPAEPAQRNRESVGTRRGLSLGIGLELFNMHDMFEFRAANHADGSAQKNLLQRMSFLQTPSDIAAHIIGRQQQLNLPPRIHISACAAATDAIGYAYRMIQRGSADWMLAGGADSMLNPLGIGGFCRLNALTLRNSEPLTASRPFDKTRDGFVMGEGAALLVLESRDHAIARGAEIVAQVIGYGNSFDAHGISEPHPQGLGAVLAMQRSLADAGIQPGEVDYLNAHGTSTPKNDVIETKAIKQVFAEHAWSLPVSSGKSMFGHLISASGAVELAGALLCAQQGYVHPTVNVKHADPECDLDYVTEGKRATAPHIIMKNSFGFGGQNASLVVKMHD